VRRVLIVAYFFPPIGGIGSIRAASFAKYLPEFGWEATVLAPADTPHAADPSLDVGEIPVLRTRSLELSRLGRRPGGGNGGDVAAAHQPVARSAPSRLLRRAVKQVVFPDPQIGWYPGAVAGGRRLLGEQRFDLIFSSAFPITSHFVGRALKRRSSLPWVAEWRDPWSDDPEFRVVSGAALRVERSMAAEADGVVLPNQTFADYYAPRWGVQAAVIGHGSDAPFNGAAPRADPPVLAHVGSYYPGRQSLETLWLALAEMRKRGYSIPRLRWVGAFPDEARAELERHGLADILDLKGFVPQPEALALMSGASGLLACDFVDMRPLSLGTTPAKLFEYIASGAPIIYVGHPQGEAARMLDRYPGCHMVPFGDVESAIRAVQTALGEDVRQRDVADLSRRARTAELARLFDAIVGSAPTAERDSAAIEPA
jgi:glycosyltransferase involved in cell wall biosynthesis